MEFFLTNNIFIYIQVGICKAVIEENSKGTTASIITQDLSVGNGIFLRETDSARITLTIWEIERCRKGQIVRYLFIRIYQ